MDWRLTLKTKALWTLMLSFQILGLLLISHINIKMFKCWWEQFIQHTTVTQIPKNTVLKWLSEVLSMWIFTNILPNQQWAEVVGKWNLTMITLKTRLSDWTLMFWKCKEDNRMSPFSIPYQIRSLFFKTMTMKWVFSLMESGPLITSPMSLMITIRRRFLLRPIL